MLQKKHFFFQFIPQRDWLTLAVEHDCRVSLWTHTSPFTHIPSCYRLAPPSLSIFLLERVHSAHEKWRSNIFVIWMRRSHHNSPWMTSLTLFSLPPSPFTHPNLSSNHQITVATSALVCTRAGTATRIHLFQEAKAIHFLKRSNRQLPDTNHTQHNQTNTWVLRYGLAGLNLKHKA